MLSGRSQSPWIQLSVFISQLASSNHFCVKTGSRFFKILACESYFSSDITPLLCAKLVTMLRVSCSLSLYTQENLFSPEYIFCSLSFMKSLISSPVSAAGHFPHRPWQKHKYRKAAK